MDQLDKQAPVTLQEQLRARLKSKIESGRYKPGDKIPTEQELSARFQVSRVTVRAAVQQLVDEHLLVRKAGKGTFVTKFQYKEALHAGGGSFTQNCLSRNVQPSTVLVRQRWLPRRPQYAEIPSPDDRILEITRIRSVNQEPCIIELDEVPSDWTFLLKYNRPNSSFLKAIIKEKNLLPQQFIDQYTIVYASKEYAQWLHCPIRTPLLRVQQEVRTGEGTMIYMNTQLILTSRYIYTKS
jgi:GntR family transcriptional regulator